MSTTGLQELAHTGLIVDLVERRPKFRWSRGNLAKHQSGRKDLCEQNVHHSSIKQRAIKQGTSGWFVPDRRQTAAGKFVQVVSKRAWRFCGRRALLICFGKPELLDHLDQVTSANQKHRDSINHRNEKGRSHNE